MATRLKPANTETVGDVLEQMDRERNIAQRIAAVMGEVDYVQKQRPKDNGMKYSFVSHDAVTKKVRPLLHKHGIVYYPRDLNVTQSGNRTEAVFTVRFENIDNREDCIDVATFGYGVDGQDKGPGKAMSYGVKYALLKVLGLETGDDPEEQQGPEADYVPEAVAAGLPAGLRDKIQTLAPKAGKTVEEICTSYRIDNLTQLTTDQAAKLITRLETLAKEPTNA